MQKKFFNIVFFMLISLTITACGGGGGSSKKNNLDESTDPIPNEKNTKNISGKLIDGYIHGATVQLKNSSNTESNLSKEDGSWYLYNIEITDEKSYLEASGGIDTSTGESFKEGIKLKRVLTESSTTFHITPLTTLVAEIVLNSNGNSLTTTEQTIAENLDLGLGNSAIDKLNSDPISYLNSNTQDAQKLIKKFFIIQKFIEAYDSIPSNDKIADNGYQQLAHNLESDTLANTIGKLTDNITNTNAKNVLNLLYQKLNDINESQIVDSTSLNNFSQAIEKNTLTLESNLSSQSYTLAFNAINSLNFNDEAQKEETNDDFNSSIENGYIQEVLNYSIGNDQIFTVDLPQGSFFIFAEPSSNNLFTQIEIDSNITDENGSSPSGSLINIINARTSSSGTAKIKITNNTTDIKRYKIPVRAYQSTSPNLVNSNIWVAAITTVDEDITTTKNFTLDIKNKTNNIGLVLSENEVTHNWNFTTDSSTSGQVTVEVTTDYETYKNPLRYFSIVLKEGTKVIGSKYTDTAIASVDVVLKSNTTYSLELKVLGGEIPAAKADSLGYYQIEIIE